MMKDVVINVATGDVSGVELTYAEKLDSWSASASCSPLQGKLALGADEWAAVEALATDPETPFAMRIAITSATRWNRNSQMMDELAWMLGYTDEQVDDLFRQAMVVIV